MQAQAAGIMCLADVNFRFNVQWIFVVKGGV